MRSGNRHIPKSYVIAGGAGFIGSHLVRRLLRHDCVTRVVVLDDFSTGRKENLEDVEDDQRLDVLDCDITGTLRNIPSAEVILHLATIANPTQYEKSPIDTLLVNSKGNENLLRIARESRSFYVYFSSSEVYGNHSPMPVEGLREESESHLFLNRNRSPYFVGKIFGEEIVRNVCRKKMMNYLIVRPFNVYGPRMDVGTRYGRVIPNFIRWAMKGLPLQINGDGTQERSFCYIDDFLDALFELLGAPLLPERIVNIGNPDSISIRQLAMVVNDILDNPAGYVFTKRYEYEPRFRTPNIDRLNSWTRWKPRIGIKEGIERIVESMREEYETTKPSASVGSCSDIFAAW